MNLKKKLQFFFKFFFRGIFKIIYGKIYYIENADNVYISLVNSLGIINFFNEKYRVYKINNGRVYTDNVSNVAIISGDKIVKNASYQQIKGELKDASHNITLEIGTPRIKKYYKGRVLSLAQGASGHTNYCHWLLDILPKITSVFPGRSAASLDIKLFLFVKSLTISMSLYIVISMVHLLRRMDSSL